MYKLRSQKGKMPIHADSLELALAYKNAVKFKFDKEVVIEPELDYNDGLDIEKYTNIFKKLPLADIVILGLDLANLETSGLDYSVLLKPIIDSNNQLVEQYKSGNEKALNALMGKFLKENKGYNPSEIKEELIKLLV